MNIGFCGVLAIVFITLKLMNVITWSWLWVLCPLWIGLAIYVGIILVGVVICGIALLLALLTENKRRPGRK